MFKKKVEIKQRGKPLTMERVLEALNGPQPEPQIMETRNNGYSELEKLNKRAEQILRSEEK